MVIIAFLYICLAWLVFFRFKLLPWNWPARIVTVLVGIGILAVFMGLLNYLTPSGRIAVVGRVVEVTPNVAGQVTAIDVEPNVLVKSGAILFQIERAPYEYKVKQLQAALAEARQKAAQLKGSADLAAAEVKAVSAQLSLAERRRDDIERLTRTEAATQFRLQDATAQVELLSARLEARGRPASILLWGSPA